MADLEVDCRCVVLVIIGAVTFQLLIQSKEDQKRDSDDALSAAKQDTIMGQLQQLTAKTADGQPSVLQ
jgi:hypothetical protein